MGDSDVNSHGTNGEKCVEIVKTMHVKLSPLGAPAPTRTLTVNDFMMAKDFSWWWQSH